MDIIQNNPYSANEIKEVLHAPNRETTFEYKVLDRYDIYKFDLETVTDGSVDYKSLGTLKRSATLTFHYDNRVDPLKDRIQIFCIIKALGKVLRYSLGIFLISTPKQLINRSESVITSDLYSKLYILERAKAKDRYVVQAGTNVVNEVERIINMTGEYEKTRVTTSMQTTSKSREWAPGTSWLEITNDLLRSINYTSLHDDVDGYFIAQPYVEPSEREVEYEYLVGEDSVMLEEVQNTLDLFDIPNVFIRYVSRIDGEPLVSLYINDNPNSSVSTVSREFEVTSSEEVEDAADQFTLDAMTKKDALNASSVYEHFGFSSAIMPFHGYLNSLYIKYDDIEGQYQEMGWSIHLKFDGDMTHEVRKVVYID